MMFRGLLCLTILLTNGAQVQPDDCQEDSEDSQMLIQVAQNATKITASSECSQFAVSESQDPDLHPLLRDLQLTPSHLRIAQEMMSYGQMLSKLVPGPLGTGAHELPFEVASYWMEKTLSPKDKTMENLLNGFKCLIERFDRVEAMLTATNAALLGLQRQNIIDELKQVERWARGAMACRRLWACAQTKISGGTGRSAAKTACLDFHGTGSDSATFDGCAYVQAVDANEVTERLRLEHLYDKIKARVEAVINSRINNIHTWEEVREMVLLHNTFVPTLMTMMQARAEWFAWLCTESSPDCTNPSNANRQVSNLKNTANAILSKLKAFHRTLSSSTEINKRYGNSDQSEDRDSVTTQGTTSKYFDCCYPYGKHGTIRCDGPKAFTVKTISTAWAGDCLEQPCVRNQHSCTCSSTVYHCQLTSDSCPAQCTYRETYDPIWRERKLMKRGIDQLELMLQFYATDVVPASIVSTCSLTIDNKIISVKLAGQDLTVSGGHGGDWTQTKTFQLPTSSSGWLAITGEELDATGSCAVSGFAMKCDHGLSTDTTKTTWEAYGSTSAIGSDHAAGLGSGWGAPCASTSGFHLPSDVTTPKIWAGNNKYAVFRTYLMGTDRCDITVDNKVISVFYAGASVTVSPADKLDDWTFTKTFSFQPQKGGKLVITGEELDSVGSNAISGVALKCDSGLTSDKDKFPEWRVMGSNSVPSQAVQRGEGAFTSQASLSTSGFYLPSDSSVKEMWGGDFKYVTFRIVWPTN